MEKARKVLLTVIAAVACPAIALQFYLNLTRHPEHTVLWRVIDFLSYFTNTTGLLVAAVALVSLLRPSSRLAQPAAIAATAVYILVVGVTYELLLRGDAHGLYFFSNTGLHEVLPVLVVALWLGFTPKADLRWSDALAWTAYPALFIAWTLARGAVSHRYPYFFADVDKLGYPRALLNGAGFLAAFCLLGLGAVALGRIGRARNAAADAGVPVSFQAETR